MNEYPESEQNSSEKEQPKYVATVDALLHDFHNTPEGENANVKARLKNFLHDIVDRTEVDAESRITTSKGEPYTREALVNQLNWYAMSLEEDKPNAMTIPSFDGLRAGVYRLANDPAVVGEFLDALKEVVQAEMADLAASKASKSETEEDAESDMHARAAIAAAHLMEEKMDAPGDTVEEEPRLTRGKTEELGEEALDAAGVEEPAPEAVIDTALDTDEAFEGRKDSLYRTHGEFTTEIHKQTSESLKRVRVVFSENASILEGADRQLSESVNESLTQLIRVVSNEGEYSSDSVRTVLKGAIESLNGVRGAALRFGREGAVSELTRALDKLDSTLDESTQEAIGHDESFQSVVANEAIEMPEGAVMAAPLLHQAKGELSGVENAARESLATLNDVIDQLSTTAFEQGVAPFEEIFRQSYNQSIQVDELLTLAENVKRAFSNELVHEAFQRANVDVSRVTEQLNGTIDTLTPNA